MQPQVAKTHSINQLDEATFQQILQAAYIIQKQNDSQRRSKPEVDSAASLAVVAETQELLRSQRYDVNAAAKLIVTRLGRIANATGIAIALRADNKVTYCAATGNLKSLAGFSGPITADVSSFLLEEEKLHRSPNDARSELLVRSDNSPVFFPVYVEGRIAAVLQLVFRRPDPIQQEQIQTYQLMAGLMGEVISHAAEVEWKQSLASERASVLQALEQLRPHLDRLVTEPASKDFLLPTNGKEAAKSVKPALPTGTPRPTPELALQAALPEADFPDLLEQLLRSTCSKCGSQISEDAKFCGKCGNRISLEEPGFVEPRFKPKTSDEPGARSEAAEARPDADHELAPGVIAEMPLHAENLTASPATDGSTALALAHQIAEPETDAQENKLALVPEPAAQDHVSPWTSATKARKWLQSLEPKESGWLVKHSGDISIITAAVVLMLVALGSNSRPAVGKVAGNKTPQPSMTLFERVLVGLGVAEAPPAPAHLGNPNVQVWEDLHTGLYYCPGADLYGKTPDGKLTNQRDAQLDQFEPAARRACD